MERVSCESGQIVTEENRGCSSLQESFLSRMERLLSLSQDTSLGSGEQVLVRRAIYATYLDCVAAGVADQARGRFRRTSSRRPKAFVEKVNDS